MNNDRWFELKLLPNEEFRDIKGYEKLYQISNYGRVKSLEKYNYKGHHYFEKILKPKINKDNYVSYSLFKNKKYNYYMVHRLVAEAFLDKKDFKCMPYENRNLIDLNTLEINHKDENTLNNNVENLEYCTHSYNINYGNRNKKVSYKKSKPILQYDLDGNFIKEWVNARQINSILGFNYKYISICCLKNQNKNDKIYTSMKYIWKFKEENYAK